MTAIRKHLRDFVAIVVIGIIALGVAFYILSNQRLRFPWEGADLRRQGRVLHRAGGHAGPGPDRARVGRARRRPHQGRPQGRPRGRHDGARPAVQGPRPHRRDGAAAPEDRPEGHVRRAAARARPRRRWPSAAGRCRSPTRCPTSTPTSSSPSLDADTRDYLTLLVGGAGAGPARAAAPTCARSSSASSPRTATWPRVSGEVAERQQNLRHLVHSLRVLNDDAGRQGPAARRRWSTPPRPCSARSPARTRTSPRGPATSRRAAPDDRHARQGRSASRRSCARRPRDLRRAARRSTGPTRRCSRFAKEAAPTSRTRSARSCATRGRSCARSSRRPTTSRRRRRS